MLESAIFDSLLALVHNRKAFKYVGGRHIISILMNIFDSVLYISRYISFYVDDTTRIPRSVLGDPIRKNQNLNHSQFTILYDHATGYDHGIFRTDRIAPRSPAPPVGVYLGDGGVECGDWSRA